MAGSPGDGPAVSLEIVAGVGRVTFARPDQGNPVNAAFGRERRDDVDELAGDSTLRRRHSLHWAVLRRRRRREGVPRRP